MGLKNLYQSALLLCSLAAALGCGAARATSIGAERILAEDGNKVELVRALSTRTERTDPLDGFHKYKGGYNITNKHYWSSTIYTGRYGYIIGTIWLISGPFYACMLLIAARTCLVKKERKQEKRVSCSKRHLLWPMLLGILLTCLSIGASGVAISASSKFHSRVHSIIDTLFEKSEEASQTIYNVTEAVGAMESVTEQYGAEGGSSNLNSTSQKLNNEAATIQRKSKKIMQLVIKHARILKVVTIAGVVLINLVVVLAQLALRPLRLYRTFYVFIIVCWLLIFLFWIFFGLYCFLFKFSGDSCAAISEYQVSPQSSTLSSILPCSEKLFAKKVLLDVREGIHDTIDQVNANISAVKSLADLVYVCNPFSGPPDFSYRPGNCASNTINVGDIPQILQKYTCSANGSGDCNPGEFVPASEYMRVQIYARSLQNILDGFPQLERLASCELVGDAFSEILAQDCKPLKDSALHTSAALAVLSAIMVAFVLILVSEALHDHKYHSTDVCVRPHPAFAQRYIFDTQMTSGKLVLRTDIL